jgi:hypothetical protein
MTPEQAEHRDDLIRRVKKFLVEVEDIEDEITSAREEDPKAWTEFDEKRNVSALRTVKHMLVDMVERLLPQVGRWEEILKPGETWENVRRRLSIEDHGAVSRGSQAERQAATPAASSGRTRKT